MYKIILYGCGKRCEKLLKNLPQNCIEIVCLVDGDSSKWDKSFYGYNPSLPYVLYQQGKTLPYEGLRDSGIRQNIQRNGNREPFAADAGGKNICRYFSQRI